MVRQGVKTMNNSPIVIQNASQQPYLSIGVKLGGVIAFGHEYIYNSKHDAFIRKDHIKKYKKCKSWEEFIESVK